MQKFNIKLRNDFKKVSLKELKTNCVKLKFKVRGLYKKLKFKAEVNFIACVIGDKNEIHNLSISDLDVCDGSSSDLVYNNFYTLTACDIIENEDCTRKIYNHLKNFINSIVINKNQNQNQVDYIVFNSSKNKIKKLNIKGYVRKYKN
jgi:hypothetical protein